MIDVAAHEGPRMTSLLLVASNSFPFHDRGAKQYMDTEELGCILVALPIHICNRIILPPAEDI